MPLYAVETVRMLIAEGRLGIEAGVCRPVGDLTTVAVPETLTALVSSRLDALAPAERALTSDAAVLGQSFTQAGLVAVSGIPEAELEPMLRQLVRRELLTQDLDPRSPERGQYSFVQALIREVAYNTLARRDRKTRHLAAARFFESLGTDELAGALASHYLAAHENASEPAEADALARQARIALRAAADRAIALGSYEQALGFLRSALTVASEPSEEADLLDRAGRAAIEAALLDEAEGASAPRDRAPPRDGRHVRTGGQPRRDQPDARRGVPERRGGRSPRARDGGSGRRSTTRSRSSGSRRAMSGAYAMHQDIEQGPRS